MLPAPLARMLFTHVQSPPPLAKGGSSMPTTPAL